MQDAYRQPCIRYRQRHNRRSKDYRQLFTINDDRNGYPPWKIKFNMKASINLQRRRPMSDDRVRRQSINSHHHASTAIGKHKSACLRAIRSLAFTFKMADNIDDQTTIDNKNYLPQNQRPHIIHSQMRKGNMRVGHTYPWQR